MKNRIHEIRINAALSMRAFANKIGISGEAVRLLENGTTKPADRTVRDICEKFNVNEHWLRTGEGEMFHQPSESLDTLAEANNIDELTRAVIVTLIEMPRNQREAFMSLVSNVANKVRSADQEGAQAMALNAAITHGTFKAAKAENLPEEDHHDFLEPRTE